MNGVGEGIIRIAMAKDICERLAHRKSPMMAARVVLNKLITTIRGAAGTLVLAPNGQFAVIHLTPRMVAGWWNGKGEPVVGDRFQ